MPVTLFNHSVATFPCGFLGKSTTYLHDAVFSMPILGIILSQFIQNYSKNSKYRLPCSLIQWYYGRMFQGIISKECKRHRKIHSPLRDEIWGLDLPDRFTPDTTMQERYTMCVERVVIIIIHDHFYRHFLDGSQQRQDSDHSQYVICISFIKIIAHCSLISYLLMWNESRYIALRLSSLSPYSNESVFSYKTHRPLERKYVWLSWKSKSLDVSM